MGPFGLSLMLFPLLAVFQRTLSGQLLALSSAGPLGPHWQGGLLFGQPPGLFLYPPTPGLTLAGSAALAGKIQVLRRRLVGGGAHRRLESELAVTWPDLARPPAKASLDDRCDIVVVERLPPGLFPDEFELQGLARVGGLPPADVYGPGPVDMERPMPHGTPTAIALRLLQNGSRGDAVQAAARIVVALPLHARYAAVGEEPPLESIESLGPPLAFLRCAPAAGVGAGPGIGGIVGMTAGGLRGLIASISDAFWREVAPGIAGSRPPPGEATWAPALVIAHAGAGAEPLLWFIPAGDIHDRTLAELGTAAAAAAAAGAVLWAAWTKRSPEARAGLGI